MRRPLSRRGRMYAVLAVLVGSALALSACSAQAPVVVTITTTSGAGGQVTVPTLPTSGSSPEAPTGDSPATTPTSESPSAPAVRVSANPAFGTKNIGPNDPITMTVFNAELQKVTMLGDDGSSIKGKVTNDKHTWTKSERLKYGVKYTITGTAKAADGSTKPVEGTFTTVKPKKTIAAYVQIPDGDTVGIAAPIIVTFADSVKDRAAAEKQLHVTTTDKDGKKITVTGSWGWMQDEQIQKDGPKQSRVHFRPEKYWPAGTRVHLEADLYGVNYGSGWGREDIVRNFKIGPNLVVKADVNSFRLIVVENDEVIRNYPVSYGKESIPGRNTVSGVHVITEKKPGAFKMCNLAYGYCDVTEYWGVRINNNGEFIHVNKQTEAAGDLGVRNVSHGCVNMSMKNGMEFFKMVYYGVPVEVTNTGVKMTPADYIWDWSVPYSEWKTFSAL